MSYCTPAWRDSASLPWAGAKRFASARSKSATERWTRTTIYSGEWINVIATPKILVVDDRPENRLTVRSVIESLPIEILEAASGDEALRLLLQYEFAVILLDVEMPGTGGFETAQIIRSRRKTRHTPIIFLTAGDRGEAGVFQGYALGAVDYMIKPFVPEILRWKVSVFADLFTKSAQAEQFIREQTARQEWEAAAKRSTLLANVATLLASSMNYSSTLAKLP